MKRYIGTGKDSASPRVVIEEDDSIRSLPMRLDLSYHSPDGFSWGYSGSGPSQLALALVSDATENDETALKFYQEFKDRVVSRLPDHWELTREDVRSVVREIELERLMASRKNHMSWSAGDVEILDD